jgi:serine/threonine-protein kinase
MARTLFDALIQELHTLQLLSPSELDEIVHQPLSQDPDLLAEQLVRRRLLTPYQLGELMTGRGKDLVLGPYILLEPIGEGGMGAVWQARRRGDNEILALKVIHKAHRADPKLRQRFFREARALTRLSHPNVVTAVDVDEAGSALYFAMEYIKGCDLARVIDRQGRLPLVPACDYIRQAALGLQHAYENGFVHRDVSPSNLLIQAWPGARPPIPENTVRPALRKCFGRWGTVKLFDLGLVLLQDNERTALDETKLTRTGFAIGTIDYTAPEQIMDAHRVDIRADLYSLGCTFYEALTGQVPFPDGTPTQKLLYHQTEEPRPVEQLRPDVPEEVVAVVKTMMAKCPDARYSTPATCVAALTRCMFRMDERTIPGDWTPIGAAPDKATPSGEAETSAPGWLKRFKFWER